MLNIIIIMGSFVAAGTVEASGSTAGASGPCKGLTAADLARMRRLVQQRHSDFFRRVHFKLLCDTHSGSFKVVKRSSRKEVMWGVP